MKTKAIAAAVAVALAGGGFAGGWLARGSDAAPQTWRYGTPLAPNGVDIILRPCEKVTAAETMGNGYDGCLEPYELP